MKLSETKTKKSIPVAYSKDGIVYLNPLNQKIKENEIDVDYLTEYYGKKTNLEKLTTKTKKSNNINKAYRFYLTDKINNGNYNYETTYEKKYDEKDPLLPVFNIKDKTPCHICISAPGLNGKTFFCNQIIPQFKKHQKIFIISSSPQNYKKGKEIDINKFVGISNNKSMLNEKLIKYKNRKKNFDETEREKIELELQKMKDNLKGKIEYKIDNWDILKNSVIVFDDWEHDNDVNKCWFLINNILTRGRHNNTNCIVITHLNTQGLQSRTLLNECQYFIVFDKTNANNLKYFLQNYIGYDGNNINKVKTMLKPTTRWVCINRINNILISPTKIELLQK